MQLIDMTNGTATPEVKPAVEPAKDTGLPAELNDLLGQYKEAPKNETPSIQNTVVGNPTTNTVLGNNPMPGQVHTPGVEYYKTGKKAGQPKPNRKIKATFTPSQVPTNLNGSILTGALFITLLDLILPVLIAAANNRFTKSKIKSSDLMLNTKQRNEIAPVADAFLRQANIEANPTITLVVALVGVYAGNYMAIKMTNELKQNNNEKTDSKTVENQNGQGNFNNRY